MNATNADPDSTRVYRQWLERHQGTNAISGSPSADKKAAIVEEFRDRATILIATESAAEGVNLQFCSCSSTTISPGIHSVLNSALAAATATAKSTMSWS